MNRVEPKNLVVGELYWFSEYRGSSDRMLETLIKILSLPDSPQGQITALRVVAGQIFNPSLVYTGFETVHPEYVVNQVKALENQLIDVALRLAIFKDLRDGS